MYQNVILRNYLGQTMPENRLQVPECYIVSGSPSLNLAGVYNYFCANCYVFFVVVVVAVVVVRATCTNHIQYDLCFYYTPNNLFYVQLI